ncbi:leucine-rich repeat protein kinase family protein [Actinidia rufa]|uniref:Leucine-rich repeat protein kinase family protein n=1 Tax=Actinidia rufa TaxID=165716 RepID=A0A7J0E3T0_9ERIC|nr:leucine-rich repeat protein kinase family protein [Actinidia rufa]
MAFWWFFSLFLFGFLSRSQLVYTQLIHDQTTLVAIGKELGLASWGLNSTNYCSWPGIMCGSTNSTVQKLDLSRRGLQGNLTLISELKALKWLDLSYNYFPGTIPPAFGDLSELEFLDLSYNKLGGSIPIELGTLKNLRSLNLSNNLITGQIPIELEGLEKLQDFQVFTNRLNGSIPIWIGNLTSLRVFTAYENELGGRIPVNLGLNSEIRLLNLHSNQLEGTLPDSIFALGKLEVLILTQNKLSGDFPESVGNCKGLSSIRIGNNKIIGSIPTAIGNVSGLTYFEANNNNLSGEIVLEFSQCSNLTLLNLAWNGFTGTIPPELGHLTNLEELIVSGNNLSGEIPTSILSCKSLTKLDLSSNMFNGTIPKDICNMTRLQYLLLSQNSIRGEIPHEIGNCVKLLELEMGSNYLTGTIPPEIGHIKNLQIALNLSFNHLHGPLPPDLGRLDKLVSLDISNNQLSGRLCGEPLSSSCGNYNSSDRESYHHKVSLKIILAVIGSGLAVFVSVTIVVLIFMMRERQEKAAKSAEIEDDGSNNRPSIIAGNLSSGTFSTVYKAVMPSGMILSVKRLKSMDRTIIHHQCKMIRELERLSKLSHENVMRPIGYVIYEDVALLLHHYLPNGTLAQFLHDSTKLPEYKPDWPTRLTIAIGVAEGLAFLHHVATIHLDISSGNVILDANYKALVGEVEISKLLDPSRGTASISAVAGSFGYIPPEYAYTMQVTAPGNVYSYGVVLLEILTTRLPVDEDFGEGIDLVKWVHNAPARGETPEQILDAKLSTVSFTWRKEMLLALKVALLCTDNTPAKRPKMKKVVEMLQEITQN